MTVTITQLVVETITTGSTSLLASLGVVASVCLIVLLAMRELASASDSKIPRLLSEFLSVGIFPLLVVFFLRVLVETMEVVG